jgi:molybdate transport system substrate-binding protein
MRLRRLCRSLAALALAAAVAGACGGDDGSTASTGAPTARPDAAEPTGKLTVFAAASLTEAFTEVGKGFEAAHPGVEVTFNFGASSMLVAQLNEGAPADVFASADEANMKKLTDAGGNAGPPVTFARNELAVIVGKGNPKQIDAVEDLADPALIVVTAAPQVPVGAYAQQVFTKAGVTVVPKSLEENVKAVVTKVTSGEADAGIVYATDVDAAGPAAQGVAIPGELNVVAVYPIVATEHAANGAAARAFIEHLTGGAGQATLAEFGFAAP